MSKKDFSNSILIDDMVLRRAQVEALIEIYEELQLASSKRRKKRATVINFQKQCTEKWETPIKYTIDPKIGESVLK